MAFVEDRASNRDKVTYSFLRFHLPLWLLHISLACYLIKKNEIQFYKSIFVCTTFFVFCLDIWTEHVR